MKNVLVTLAIIYLAVGLVFGVQRLTSKVYRPPCEKWDPPVSVFDSDKSSQTISEMPQPSQCHRRGIALKDVADAGIWTVGWGYFNLQRLVFFYKTKFIWVN